MRIEYQKGQVVGPHGCKYVQESDPVFYKSRQGSVDFRTQRMKRRAVFECPLCASFFESVINKVQCGNQRSCGCLVKTQDGLSWQNNEETPLHYIWRAMKSRCNNPKNASYKHYGGRGIKVCSEWQQSFLAFHAWAVVNGYEQELQIDRRNNNGDYEPSNCRFVTCKVNQSNKRNNRYCFLNGERMTISEAGRKLAIPHATIVNWSLGRFPNKFSDILVFENPISYVPGPGGRRDRKYCWVDGEKMLSSHAAKKLGVSQSAMSNWVNGKTSKNIPHNLAFKEPLNV